jgi:NAD(P)-dependent dehydrogenase (short-subunit alcohol dehydrogenase family)
MFKRVFSNDYYLHFTIITLKLILVTSHSEQAGRKHGIRINTISAGPLASRAAKAIGGAGKPKSFIDYAIDYSKANAPMAQVYNCRNFVFILKVETAVEYR